MARIPQTEDKVVYRVLDNSQTFADETSEAPATVLEVRGDECLLVVQPLGGEPFQEGWIKHSSNREEGDPDFRIWDWPQ